MSDKHSENCKVCQYGADEIDWTLSNRVIGDIVDCAESSVRRHKKWASVNGVALDTDLKVLPEDESPGPHYKPRRVWQGPNGEMLRSWEYVGPDTSENFEWDYSSLMESLGDFEYDAPVNYSGAPEFFIWADPQLGKAMEKGGGTRETIARTFQALASFIERVEANKPSVIYFVDLGDGIENCFSTGSQIGTNDLSVPDQVLTYERVTVEIIKRLLPHAVKVVHVTVTSNHGEARNGMKNNPYGSENDWGLHMQKVVQDRFSESPDLPVEFLRPERNEDTSLVVTEDGSKVAFAHGHHAGSPSNVVKWVEGQVVGEQTGWDATIWVLGHFHHSYSASFGKGKKIFGAPSCDPGSAWVTRKKGVEAQPGVLALTVSEGRWFNYSIL